MHLINCVIRYINTELRASVSLFTDFRYGPFKHPNALRALDSLLQEFSLHVPASFR